MTRAAARRRILFLLPFPPHPEGLHGGSRVTGQLLECLATEHEVGALYLRGPGDAAIAEPLLRLLAFAEAVARPDLESTPVRRALRFARRTGWLLRGRPVWVTDWAVSEFSERVSALVREWRPDVVQAEFHVMGQYLRAAGPGAGRILVEHEPGAAAAAGQAVLERGARRIPRLVDTAAWRRWESRLLRLPDATVVFTDEDRAALLQLQPSAHIVRIRPGVPIPRDPLDPLGAHPPRILYFGSFAHPPNVDAALRLARAIFPTVRASCPDALLEIVGDSPPRQIRELERTGVSVVGRVEDVLPYLARAAAIAAPLRLGGGVRVKLLEALAAGKAVVATPLALTGLEVVPGEHVLVGTTDKELAAALVTVLDDPERRGALARAGRAWASAHLGWAAAKGAYESLYAELPRARRGESAPPEARETP